MEPEVGYVSNYLTHFVGRGKTQAEQYEILKRILHTCWLTHPPHLDQPSLAVPVHPDRHFADNEMIVPEMICFCDIPAPHLGIHTQKYSRFGIVFPKHYLIGLGANPVLYVAKRSGVLRKKPALRKAVLPKKTLTPTEYEELKTQAMDPNNYDYEPRSDVLEEHMRLFWELWYAKESFESGGVGADVADVLRRDRRMWTFFVTHILGFVKCFDDALPVGHPDNFYMEREWRRLGNLQFEPANVTAVYVPPEMVDQCCAECPEYADRVQPLRTAK